MLGTDWTLRYQPLRNNQFRSLTWGTELLYSDNRYQVNPNSGSGTLQFDRTVPSFGLYSYLAYKFDRQWTAGFLYQWLESPQNNHDQNFRVLSVHHVGHQPLESTAPSIHVYRPQPCIRPA